MEIHIRLAGVELGPYSEKQVREYLDEGLLSPHDLAKQDGTENWIAVTDLLSNLPRPIDPSVLRTAPMPPTTQSLAAPTVPLRMSEPSSDEEPKRAPEAPPGVSHLPVRQQDSQKSLAAAVDALSKRTVPIGPSAPAGPSPSGHTAFSTMSTSPLVPPNQGTKKVSRSSLAKALSQQTAPLPNKVMPPPPATHQDEDLTDTEALPSVQPDAKKASLPSLLKSLTAKTVPMRNTPAAPPLKATLPITAPLPTRLVPKPPSGPVPPPSIAKGLTKKLGQMVQPDPVQTSPPTLGLDTETTAIAPSKIKAKEKPATPVPAEPAEEPSSSPAPRRILSILIVVCSLLALLLLYYVWSPYHAAASLRSALISGTPADLDATIDFDSVKASLKDQIKSQLAAGNAPADSATSTAFSMLDKSIDLYVTSAGISGLVNKNVSFSKDDLAQTISTDVAAQLLQTLIGQPVKNQGLASYNDFVVQTDAAMFHLQLQGIGWKLKRVEVSPDLVTPASPGSPSPLILPVVNTLLEQGDAKSKLGEGKEASAIFTQVLAIDPQSAAAYNERGAARLSQGDPDGAIKDFTQALTLDPHMAAAFDGRGNAKAGKNDLDGAIADFTQAVTLDPTMAVAYDSRGNAKTVKDDLDGAIADFTQAITLDPNLASAYSDRGFARQANGNLDGAISDYTQALALKPKTAVAYYNRGLARQSQGNLEAAIVDYDRALAFDPKIAGAYYNRGNAKNALHDLDGAIADYTKAVTLNPKIALAYCNRGVARQAKGDLDGAVADYTQALAIDPKIAIAYYNRGLIEAQKNDLDGAIADSTHALDIDPKNAQAYYNRGFAKLTKGNLDGALADLKQFCDLDPRDHDADHARLYIWLISKTQNSTPDPDQALSDALENSWNSPPDDTATKTANFLLGRINETDYLAAAASPDAKADQSQHCESWYFAAMKRLLMGDKLTAIDYFHKCVATGQKDYYEYILAEAELLSLEPTPPPATTPSPAAVPAPAKLP